LPTYRLLEIGIISRLRNKIPRQGFESTISLMFVYGRPTMRIPR
jgi:hypothetical protein